jgi:hypothetical protein
MVTRILAFWRRRRDGDPARNFTLDDIAQYISNPERAEYALEALQDLVRRDLVDVYLPAGWVAAGHRRFNVWMDRRIAPPSGERITLEEWCARWREDWRISWRLNFGEDEHDDDDGNGGAA